MADDSTPNPNKLAPIEKAWDSYWKGDHPALYSSLRLLTPEIEGTFTPSPSLATQYWLLMEHIHYSFEHVPEMRMSAVRALGYAEESESNQNQIAVLLQGVEQAFLLKDFGQVEAYLQTAARLDSFFGDLDRNEKSKIALRGKLSYFQALLALRHHDKRACNFYLETAQNAAKELKEEYSFYSTVFGPTHLGADLVYYILCSGGINAAKTALAYADTVKTENLKPIRFAQLLTDESLAYSDIGDREKERFCLRRASSIIPNYRRTP